MIIKLIKTTSDNCPKCDLTDFKVINGAKVCMGCLAYLPKELVRDIKKRK